MFYTDFGDKMINISGIRHSFPERDGLLIERPLGYGEYTFLHFFQSVEILVDGRVLKTKPNAVIIYGKNTPQYFKTEEPLVHNWMHFSGDISSLLQASIEPDKIYYPKNPTFITSIMYELETEFYGNRENREQMLELKFQELFLKISRAVSQQNSADFQSESIKKFHLLREEIFFDLSVHYSIEELSRKVGYSPSRFYNIYKEIYGTSPNNDIITARIEKAKDLLSAGNMSVCDIAQKLGYENTTHFIRQFKAKTGFSPTKYKFSER